MLKNLVGLVTGGASGLGLAAARTLIDEGCIITIGDLPQSDGKKIASSLGSKASFAPLDVCSEDTVKQAMSQITLNFKRLDFVVHCAGIACAHKLYNRFSNQGISQRLVERVVKTNVCGTINVNVAAAEYIYQNDPNASGFRGNIVNVAGLEGIDGQIGQTVIAATSGAIMSLVRPAAHDLSNLGIRVNCICVGAFDTPMMQGLPDEVKKHLAESCSFPKRFGSFEDFGHAVRFLLENKYINGSVIRLDAGLRHYFA